MKKKIEKVIMILTIIILAIFTGCIAMQKSVTPAYIKQPVLDYVKDSNGILPFKIPLLWWMSVADAELIDKLLDFKHDQRQILFERAKEDDRGLFALLKGQHYKDLQNAYALQQVLFSPEGTIGLLLSTGLGVLLGTMGLSKPSDKQQIESLEMEIKLNNNESKNNNN